MFAACNDVIFWILIFVFIKQNRVIKQLEAERAKCKREARLESKPVPIRKETVEDKNKINNNVTPKVVIPAAKPQEKPTVPVPAPAPSIAPIQTTTTTKSVVADPFRLPKPADYDDYNYEHEGEWYNEYDDELEEGFYYGDEEGGQKTDVVKSKGLPKPADYEDYWYEYEGEWYNEYDDELEEGQFYEEAAGPTPEEIKKKEEEEKRKADEAKKAKEAAAKKGGCFCEIDWHSES